MIMSTASVACSFRIFGKNCMLLAFCVALFFTFVSAQPKPKILVFTKTQGYDHGTRVVADSLILSLGAKNGFDVDTTNTATGFFTDAKLSSYKAVCFINTTGNLMTDAEKAAFQRFITAGNGYVGMHASADCEYAWPWYHELLGAYFVGHPFNIALAKIAILDRNNPSSQFIKKDTIIRTDEWYFFDNNTYAPAIDPAKLTNLHVLMNLVESSLPNSTQSKYHPICWYQTFAGGKAWYSGFGHNPAYFRDTIVQKNLLGGILWASGMSATPVTFKRATVHPLAPLAPPAVYDATGRKIRTLNAGNNSASGTEKLWDYRDDFGKSVSAGRRYFIEANGRPCLISKPQ
jgi:type 1 glutamine amidotransferase